ncbi:hypothetical protein SUDANB51_04265 [Streptomyces sp. enrichment culture]|nr:hypothetical protein DF19_14425 [Streptomyces olindensis]
MYIADLVPGRVWRRSPDGAYGLVSDEVKVPNGITCVGDRTTGERRVAAEDLPVGRPPGPAPALFTHGVPGLAPRFAGLAAAPDGSLLLSADAEGTVLRLTPDA